MTSFSLLVYNEVNGKIPIFKLSKDSKCEFDEFCSQIEYEGNLVSQLRTIITRIELIAQGNLLPHNKFKPIKLRKSEFNGYEIKTNDLRVYIIQQPKTGKIIVCGGKKSTQDSDIKHFNELAKQYEDFLKTIL